MRRVFHAAARKAAGGGKGKRERRRGYDPRRGTVDGKYFASVLQWWLETEEGAAKRNPPHAPPISMLRESGVRPNEKYCAPAPRQALKR